VTQLAMMYQPALEDHLAVILQGQLAMAGVTALVLTPGARLEYETKMRLTQGASLAVVSQTQQVGPDARQTMTAESSAVLPAPLP
jgi:hypothetical protein